MELSRARAAGSAVQLDKLVIAGSATIFVLLCALFWGFIADDAYIVGRYAANAAAGAGLVYNAGEYVSALTSPLHAMLETMLAVLGFDPVDGYRVIAPVLVLGGWAVAIWQLDMRGPSLWLFTAVGLFSPFLALWTVGGLETALLAGLATTFAAFVARVARDGQAKGVDFAAIGVVAALMFLARYDSVLTTLPILVAIIFVEFRRRSLWVAAVISFCISISWLIFAKLYYGDIFPTSFYLKYVAVDRSRIDSVSSLINFGFLSGLFLFAFLMRPKALAEKSPLARAISRGVIIATGLFVFYASKAAGQHMMFGYRLFLPYILPAALMIALSLREMRPRLPVIALGWQAVMVALVYSLGINLAPLSRLPLLNHAYHEYEFITVDSFAATSEMLEDQARQIAAHWEATGLEGTPSIYLRTGGMGYFMPEFYVYEALVSYRHQCGLAHASMVKASHYAQQLGTSVTGTFVQDLARTRTDVADDATILFARTVEWGGAATTGYMFGREPIAFQLGSQLDSDCG